MRIASYRWKWGTQDKDKAGERNKKDNQSHF
jgi:hypothetical protein